MNTLKASATVIVNGRIYAFRDAKAMAEAFKIPSDCLEACLSIGSESMQRYDTAEVAYTFDDVRIIRRPWWKLWK